MQPVKMGYGLLLVFCFTIYVTNAREYVIWLKYDSKKTLNDSVVELKENFGLRILGTVQFQKFRAAKVDGVDPDMIKVYEQNSKILAIEPSFEMSLYQNLISQMAERRRLSNYMNIPGDWTETKARSIKEGVDCNEIDLPSDRFWALNRIAHRGRWITNKGNMTYYYNGNRDGSGVAVYVFDTGIQLSHNEFEERAEWGFTSSDVRYSRIDDHDGHGTHVAGLIGGKTVGVAKDATLVAVKVVTSQNKGSMFGVLEGMQFLAEDAKERISAGRSKFAIGVLALGADSYSKILDGAVHALYEEGILMVAAAGNDKMDACYTTSHLRDAVTVGAVTARGRQAVFSNFGKCVDILAPGDDVLSTFIGHGDNNFASTSGTSMAAAMVVGALAKELEDVNRKPKEAKKRILEGSTKNVIQMLVIASDESNKTPNRLLFSSCDATGKEAGNLIYPRKAAMGLSNGWKNHAYTHLIFSAIFLTIFVYCF